METKKNPRKKTGEAGADWLPGGLGVRSGPLAAHDGARQKAAEQQTAHRTNLAQDLASILLSHKDPRRTEARKRALNELGGFGRICIRKLELTRLCSLSQKLRNETELLASKSSVGR